jgi:hypothetical protein
MASLGSSYCCKEMLTEMLYLMCHELSDLHLLFLCHFFLIFTSRTLEIITTSSCIHSALASSSAEVAGNTYTKKSRSWLCYSWPKQYPELLLSMPGSSSTCFPPQTQQNKDYFRSV